MPNNGCWVLTREINAYEQDGEYFVAVWEKKPTIQQLAKHFGHTQTGKSTNVFSALDWLMHLEKGGGRQGVEDEWFNLVHTKFKEN